MFTRWGQPSVVGEVLAGFCSVPSFARLVVAGGVQFIFPTESLGVLKLLSQIGVCLFMFVVGLELEVSHLRQKAQTARAREPRRHLVPLFSRRGGSVVSLFQSWRARKFVHGVWLVHGIFMSITAFRAAHILKERGLRGRAAAVRP